MRNLRTFASPTFLTTRLFAVIAILFLLSSLTATAYMKSRDNSQSSQKAISQSVTQQTQEQELQSSKPLPIDDSYRAPAPPDTSGKSVEKATDSDEKSDGQNASANQDGHPSLSAFNGEDLFVPNAVINTTYPASVASGVALDTMTGSTQLLAASQDDTASLVTNIGFDFWFDGVRYTQFSVNANGLMRLGATAVAGTSDATSRTNNLADGNNDPKLAPYWDDLCTSSTGKVHYLLTGTAPNRKLTVEFQNMRTYSGGCTSGTLLGNYQVWIYESSRSTLPGVVAFVYGAIPVNPNANGGYTVGISSSSTSFASITTATPSVSYATSNNTQVTAITSGTAYLFTPNIPAAPTSLTFTNVSASSMTLNWVDNATNEVGYVLYISTDGTTYAFLAQIAANATGVNINGLTPNTTYFYKVYAVTEGALSTVLSGSQATSVAVPVNGTKTVCPSGCNYATLTAAVADVTANGVNGAIVLELGTTYNGTGETFPIIIGNISGNSSTNTITVRPATGATNLSISSANTTATIALNGAKNVIFDGQPGGTGGSKQLTVANTDTATGAAFLFINDATTNKIQYCTVRGVNTSTASGVIVFSTTTGTTGNDSNTIDNCDIRDGATTPTHLIYSLGTTTTTTLNNSSNTISNSNLFNFFQAATNDAAGIRLDGGNTDWTITGNSLYQTASRTTTSGTTARGIYLNNTSGNNFVVTGNYIGGTAANAGSTPWTVAGSFANRFEGIRVSVGTTTASSVQGNTIANFSWLSTSGTTTLPANWIGVYVTAGNVNIGTTTSNTIGSGTGTGSVTVTNTANTNASYGIGSSSSGTVAISNNTIGSITLVGSATTVSNSFTGISVTAGTNTVSANTIGSTATANSINSSAVAATATTGQSVTGISSASSTSASITNNTIANLNNNSTGTTTTAQIRGIVTSAGVNTITGNTIRNLTTTNNNTGTESSAAAIGIAQSSSSAGQSIGLNTIHTLSVSPSTAATAININGIYYSGGTTTPNTIERNYIHSLTTSSTGAAVIFGVNDFNGSATFRNNMIRLGIDAAGNSITGGNISFIGLRDDTAAAATNNYYFNSIYIGGTGVTTGTAATYAYRRTLTPTLSDVRDNILVNARSNSTGTGKHYAIQVDVANSTLTSDYNDLYAPGTGGFVGGVGATDYQTLALWKAGTGKDTNSISADPQFANATGNSTVVNLHVLSTSPVSNVGIAITGQTNDFDGQTRGTPPDIGADEINGDTFQFSSAAYLVNEAAGTVTITVTRTGDATTATSVNYATSDGTATAGSDYTATSGTLNFVAGQTTASFTVPIINDTLFEGSTAETFLVTLSGATTGTPNPATVSIVDNDTAPTISINSVTVNENAGTATFTVTQSAASGLNTTFTYSTANGTATAGSDYTAATNVAGTITAGNTTTTITISILQDAIAEGTETFTVTLGNPVNATIAAGTGTGSITDDDLAFNSSGNLPAGTYDNITINSPAVVTLTGNITVTGTLTINSGGTLNTGAFIVSGGTFTLNAGGTLGIGSPAGISASGASGNIQTTTRNYSTAANYTYNGTAAQVTGSGLPATVNNLTINNSAGVGLSGGVTISSTLALTAGILNTGANTLTMGDTATSTGAHNGANASYVVGTMKKLYVTVPQNFTFDLGTVGGNAGNGFVDGYTPAAVNAQAGSATGDVTATVTNAFHPTLTGRRLRRFWTLTNNGLTLADLQFTYLDGDVPDAADEASYVAFKIDGAAVTYPVPNSAVDAGNNRINVTGATSFSDWTAGAANAVTAIRLKSFEAINDNGQVLVNWQSGYEVSNLGYNVYREVGGQRTRVTPTMVAGSALLAGTNTVLTAGQSYAWLDRLPKNAGEVQYWLEDVDINGTRTMHGPIAPVAGKLNQGQQRQRSALLGDGQESGGSSNVASLTQQQYPASMASRLAQLGKATLKGSQEALNAQQTIAAQRAVKIGVKHAGWYHIGQAQLVAAGIDAAVNPAMLQLYADGVEIPMSVTGGKEFDATSGIEFYGVGLDTAATETRNYWLIAGSTPGRRIKSSPASTLNPDNSGAAMDAAASTIGLLNSAQSFSNTVESRERLVYFTGLDNGDAENFFGKIITSQPVSQTLSLSGIDAQANSQAQLEVTLQGVTAQMHQVRVLLNGSEVGVVNFADREHAVAKLAVNAASLIEGANTLQFVSLVNESDISLVDKVSITYARRYVAEGNQLRFSAGSLQPVKVTGFNTNQVRVIDITDPKNVQELTPTVEQQDGGTYAITVRATGLNRRTLIAFPAGQAEGVAAVIGNEPSNWSTPDHDANYVIITHSEFAKSAERLAELRRGEGMTVAVVDVEDLYDEFNYGARSPQAIRDFLQSAQAWQTAPHYALLIGDATYDPRNYKGEGFNDLMPTKMLYAETMETASDDWFADFNDDNVPEMAIGRLPVRTAEEASLMVSKITGYVPGNAGQSALLVADRNDGYDFESASSGVQGLLPSGMTVQTINRSTNDVNAVRSQIINGINQGPMLVNYFGHGSVGLWSGSGLLTTTDTTGLTNGNRLPMFTLMTCLNGFFQDTVGESMAESLLKAPNGGAVAVWASSGLTGMNGQSEMDQKFYQSLFSNSSITIGEAIRDAKAATSDNSVRRTWIFFGDPTMRLR